MHADLSESTWHNIVVKLLSVRSVRLEHIIGGVPMLAPEFCLEYEFHVRKEALGLTHEEEQPLQAASWATCSFQSPPDLHRNLRTRTTRKFEKRLRTSEEPFRSQGTVHRELFSNQERQLSQLSQLWHTRANSMKPATSPRRLLLMTDEAAHKADLLSAWRDLQEN